MDELPACTCKSTRISLGTVSDRHAPHCRARREYERQVRAERALLRERAERAERVEELDRFGNDD